MNVLQSLENLALIKVAIAIYHSSEISELKEKFRKLNGDLDIFQVKQLFHETISNSVLPFGVREKLLGVMKPIIMDIESWNVEKRRFGIHKQLDICLTSAGTIDRKETAKKFVRSEDQNIVERFAVATHFWMTDDVLKIWNNASVSDRIYIENELAYPKDAFSWVLDRPHQMTDEDYESLETTEHVTRWFDWLHDGGDRRMLYNFLDDNVLPHSRTIPEPNLIRALPQEKLQQLMRMKYGTYYFRVYFSSLDYNQKLTILQQKPFMILHDYLEWPLQFKFLEMANQAWKYLTGKDFYKLLYIISEEKILPLHSANYVGDFDYEGLLREFWKQSPHHLKISAKEQHDCQSSLAEIVEMEIEVVSPSIVPSGSFTELKSHCHLYGAQGQRQAYLLPIPR
ncbi:uncharacterized protein TNCV_2587061 [Trichonephila clavipes]|nr:uncharacterized protein TNCV_2587061 [Trichonephila clavipes]